MKKKGRILVSAMIAACMSIFTIAGASCGPASTGDDSASSSSATQNYTAVGEYYCEANGQENTLSIKSDDTVTLVVGSATHTGTYTYDGTSMQFNFTDGTKTTVAVSGGVIDVAVEGGGTYSFIADENLTVTYMDGADVLSTASVRNGKTAESYTAPAKDGYAFVGWYTSPDFEKAFSFSSSITSDTTLYARYIQKGESEYLVDFDLNYDGAETIAPQTTAGGKLYGLPAPAREGYTFVGWWVSDYQDAEKLTYQYTEGEEITENLTLYAVWDDNSGAPFVSVNAEGITWTASGTNNSYSVVIKDSTGNQIGGRTGLSVSAYSYNFSNQEAGDYTVSVTSRGQTTTVYYKNKALSRVSLFSVVDSVIVFNEVENAENYYITIDCGNEDHTHTYYALGSSSSYDFSACDMQEGGITFIVTAEAQGYVSSVSETYVYERHLDAITGLTVSDEVVSWNPVEYATDYILNINGREINVGSATSYDLKSYAAGEIAIKVYPKAKGFNSSAAVEESYTKTTIAAPANVAINGATVTWDEVEGAQSYKVMIGDKVYTSATNSFVYSDAEEISGNEFKVSVQAIASTETANSRYSDILTVKYGEMDNITYALGTVSWSPVFGCNEYMVKINDGEAVKVSASAYDVVFDRAGANTISVCAVKSDGTYGDWVSATVDVKSITFDVQEGEEVATLYKVSGDEIELPTTVRDGYDFVGWFDAPEGGERYTASNFIGNADITLYAVWKGSAYTVTLDVGSVGESMEQTEYTVYYGEGYTLPVPVSSDPTKAFAGWFTEPNATGLQYTDYQGGSSSVWRAYDNRTLYAGWVDIFTFTLDGQGKNYLVSKGAGINYVVEVTVPATYKNLPVSTVEGFAALKNLKIINIPDTVTNIETDTAFTGCTALQAVNIYEVDQAGFPHDVAYESDNGVLLYSNPNVGKELVYYPEGKRNTIYYIPNGVESLPTRIFSSSSLVEIYIPATVTYIGENAFGSCSNLTTVVFLSPDEGETAKTLTLATNAFYSRSKLTEITLPSRMAENLDFPTIFTLCNNLKNIYVDGTDGYYVAVDGMLCVKTTESATNNLKLVFCPKGKSGEIRIPNGVTVIGKNAFVSNTKLTAISIPSWVKEIGESAFEGCGPASSLSGITTVIFEGRKGDVDLTIGKRAFYGCNITEITLPGNLVTLGENAFGKTSIGAVTVYADCYSSDTHPLTFAEGAFSNDAGNCYVTNLYLGADFPIMEIASIFGGTNAKLQNVTVDENNQNYASADGVLFNKEMTKIVYFPLEKGGEYQIPDTVTEIGANVFTGRTALTKVIIPASVVSIGDSAFYNCSKLEEVVFLSAAEGEEEKTLTIGDSAFRGCTVLTTVTVPSRVSEIGSYAFASCSSLVEFTIPEGVTTVGDYAFAYSVGLSTVNISASVAFLGEYNQPQTEGEEATMIAMNLFFGCTALENIVVDLANKNFMSINGILYGKNENGEASVLYYCPIASSNTVINIPNTVTSIWDRAFYNNASIVEINFSAVAAEDFTIGLEVFYNCTLLEKVSLPKGVLMLSTNLFYNCKALTEVVVPNTVTLMDVSVFYGCSNLSVVRFEEGNDDAALVLADGTYTSTSGGSYNTVVYKGVFSYYSKTTGSSNSLSDYGCTALKEITFPDRLSTIGAYAFACTNIETVNISKGVTQIADGAFINCASLQSVNFADESKLDSIGAQAFYGSSITQIELPESLTTIASGAFRNTKLTSVLIPAGVTTLGDETTYNGAFYGCTELTEVRFADNSKISLIGYYAFYGCSKLAVVDFGKNSSLETIYKNAFGSCSSLYSSSADTQTLVIPASVKTIESSAFSGCKSLQSITFATDENGSSSLQSIGNNAFEDTGLTSFDFPKSTASSITLGSSLFKNCKLLTDVYLSESVTEIDSVFANCSSISVVNVSENSENFSSDESGAPILYNKNGTAIRMIFGEIDDGFTIKEGVVEIGERAFESQGSIKNLVIPKTVEKIGDYAFYNCLSLENLTFEKGSALIYLGAYAFYNCRSLKEISVPEGVTKLHNYTFFGCISLEKVTLPEGLEQIGEYVTTNASYANYQGSCYVFANCYSLTDINIPSTVTSMHRYLFFNCTSLETITIPSSMTYLPYGLFDGCSSLKNVTLNEGLVYIGYNFSSTSNPDTLASAYVFRNCVSLESIVIPASVKLIQGYSFNGCTSLQSIDVSSVTTFGTYVFSGCTSLASVKLSEELTTLGNYMFQNCTSLASINLPNSISYMGIYTFQGCESLSSVKTFDSYADEERASFVGLSDGNRIPNGVTMLGESATACAYNKHSYVFSGCASLTSIDLNNVKKVGGSSFLNCSQLASVDLSKVTLIGPAAFSGTALTEVDLSGIATGNMLGAGSVTTSTTIPGIFQNCTSLAKVTFASGLTLSAYMFKGCTSLTTVDVSAARSLGTYLFEDCTSLSSVTLKKASTGKSTFTALGNYMFKGCTSLKEVDLPTNLTALGTYTFQNSGLTRITIPSGVKYLGSGTGSPSLTTASYVFDGCVNLTEVTFHSAFLRIGAYAFRGCTSLTTLNNLTALAYVGNYAFEGCTSLDSVTFTDSLLQIGTYAFANTGIATITIPKSVTSIGTAAFGDCASLTDITVAADNTKYMSEDGVLYTVDKAMVCYPAGKTPADGTVTLADDITVNTYAFYGCGNIRKIVFPEGTTTISGYFFYGMDGLEEFEIPASVTTIAANAFRGSSVKKIVIPETVTSVGEGAFAFSQLEELEIKSADTVFADGVAANTRTKYGVFEGCQSLTKVILDDGVTTLANYMFAGCTALTSIELPESLTTIGAYAFRESALEELKLRSVAATAAEGETETVETKKISLPATLVSVGNYAFYATGVKEVYIGVGEEATLGTYLFANCESLTKVGFAETVISLPNYLFQNCTALESVTIPDTVTTMGMGIFDGCSALSSVKLSAGVTTYSTAVFRNCVSLTSIEIPEGVTTLGVSMFSGTGLSSVKLPATVESISSAFANCLSLKSIFIPATVTTVSSSCFQNWTEDQTIYIEALSSEVYNSWTTEYNWVTNVSSNKLNYNVRAKVVFGYTPTEADEQLGA